MLSVRTNVGAVNASRNLFGTNMSLTKSMEKLSSGFRINRAGDDAAGLAISEKLKAQVSGLNQAARNSLDGISMIQTAEAGMDELQSMMQRMRDLSVQASNETLGQGERDAVWEEVDQLRQEMNNIASRTQFNGQSLLDGSLVTTLDATTEIKVGLTMGAGQAAQISALDVSTAATNAAAVRTFRIDSPAAGQIRITDQTDATKNQTLNIVDADFNTAFAKKELNFDQLGIKFTIQVGSTAGKTAANVVTDLTGANNDITVAQGSGAAQIQSGANQGQLTNIAFTNVQLSSATAAGLAALNTHLITTMNSQANRSAVNFGTLINKVDGALGDISTERAKLGALQNRLEHSIANVKGAAENLSASNSRIRDVDVAEESSALAKFQILSQSGVAMLAQANQMPQLALKLLG